MKRHIALLCIAAACAAAVPAWALNPGTDLVVPAAFRGAGSGSSVWVTDMYVYNPGALTVSVTVSWLPRQANPSPASASYQLPPGETLVLEDLVNTVFAATEVGGAFRVQASGEVAVTAAILNTAGGTVFAQGFEGVPVDRSIGAGQSTDAMGLIHNAEYRSNFFVIDTSGSGSTVTVSLRSPSGAVLASRQYTLGAWEPILRSVAEIGGPNFDDATLHVEVSTGQVVAGGSRVNQSSGDPVTLESWWTCGGGGELTVDGWYYGAIAPLSGYPTGVAMNVGTGGDIIYLDMMYGSEKIGCEFSLPVGPGPPQETLFLSNLADGVEVEVPYVSGGTSLGTIVWTITLTEGVPNLYYTGSISGEGSGWSGTYASCNGSFAAQEIFVGKNPGS